jgi:hypothetical protein
MTPVTLELVIDDSKRERKRKRDMENDEACVAARALRVFTIDLRAPSPVNENAGASLMNGEMDE